MKHYLVNFFLDRSEAPDPDPDTDPAPDPAPDPDPDPDPDSDPDPDPGTGGSELRPPGPHPQIPKKMLK